MKVIHLILINLLIYASVYGQELIKFQENGKYGFRDENGNIIIPAKYDNADDFYDGLAKVGSRSSDKYGIIDKTGKEITPLKYDVIGDFSEGLARVREKHWSVGGKYGYIDKFWNEFIAAKYDYAEEFSNGLVKVQLDIGGWFVVQTQ